MPSKLAIEFVSRLVLRYGFAGDHVVGSRSSAEETLRLVAGHVADVSWGLLSRNAEGFRQKTGESPMVIVSFDCSVSHHEPIIYASTAS